MFEAAKEAARRLRENGWWGHLELRKKKRPNRWFLIFRNPDGIILRTDYDLGEEIDDFKLVASVMYLTRKHEVWEDLAKLAEEVCNEAA